MILSPVSKRSVTSIVFISSDPARSCPGLMRRA
jgi:hypothetical protein